MAHGNAVMESGESAGQGGGGVSLDEDQRRFFTSDDGFEASHDSGTNFIGSLVGLHDVQVLVKMDAKEIKEWVEQAGVLAGADGERANVGASFERAEHGREFDDLGARAENT